ncbi:arginyl-tRNA--protein transferase 1-like isoform X2 [Paramacrobiotus metropolitanus]|uniref:arginyl-tRNA--protein transferase 1-like isoform X2 n=1 Tax=Paramacrobiotus metropolitanus TaxID=2943436 RepID=UPI0024458CD5|nr:arginyl-tRNA--protein transferase 1-like isoform X2 [Paramacrobiotus metropolitanus]
MAEKGTHNLNRRMSDKRRRSGKYIYKPVMKKTCCPQYAIRCEALKFQPTKSQKKVLRRMYNYLAWGKGEERIRSTTVAARMNGQSSDSDLQDALDDDDDSASTSDEMEVEGAGGAEEMPHVEEPPSDTHPENIVVNSDNIPSIGHLPAPVPISSSSLTQPIVVTQRNHVPPAKGKGPDPNKPLQRKAKEVRREKKAQKLLRQGVNPTPPKSSKSTSNSLETYLEKPLPDEPKHHLEFRLISTSDNDRDSEFTRTFDDVFQVYAKYELTIHKKDADHPTPKQFSRFLAESPLQRQLAPEQADNDEGVYGSFHLHYVLDGKIIGVDVVDVLPDCLTSVYFFYDPDYSYLSLGTYSVLREMYMVRQLHTRFPSIQFASLGFYVHSCAKMHYKATFQPSFLLCPETYTWHPLPACLPKLSVTGYQRLARPEIPDEEGRVCEYVNQTLILFKRNLMTFELYRITLQRSVQPAAVVLRKEVERVTGYALLVGRQCAPTMALYCDNAPIHQPSS